MKPYVAVRIRTATGTNEVFDIYAETFKDAQSQALSFCAYYDREADKIGLNFRSTVSQLYKEGQKR